VKYLSGHRVVPDASAGEGLYQIETTTLGFASIFRL
jgi:hypothetical protein